MGHISKILNIRAIPFEILRGGTDWKKSLTPPTHFFHRRPPYFIFFANTPPPHIFIFCLQYAPPEDLKWNRKWRSDNRNTGNSHCSLQIAPYLMVISWEHPQMDWRTDATKSIISLLHLTYMVNNFNNKCTAAPIHTVSKWILHLEMEIPFRTCWEGFPIVK